MNTSIHERIRRDFEQKILTGRLLPGSRLPTERELMGHYDCARMTVSKAISALAAAGLIERRKRAGSFVARPVTHSMMMDIPDLEGDARARGEIYAFEVKKTSTRSPRSALEREICGNGKVLVIEGVHVAAGRPFATERRLINVSAIPDAASVDWGPRSPGAWLLTHVPWTEAESRVTAVNASAEVARRLNLTRGEACLALERRTWRRHENITRVRQVFAPGAIEFVARFGAGYL